MTHEISVKLASEDDTRLVFDVTIGQHRFRVTAEKEYCHRLTGDKLAPEELVRKSFEFLLEREGPESILKEFDLPLINHYFPEYERTIQESLTNSH